MQEAILKFIENRQNVSVVELRRELPGFAGNLEWYFEPNVVIWNGCSEAAVDAMTSLLRDGKITFSIVSPLVYMVDGETLAIPVVTASTLRSKKPHWLPVTFSIPDKSNGLR